MLAKIYKCPFVEMSALLSANVDILWNEVIRKLYKYERVFLKKNNSFFLNYFLKLIRLLTI